MKIIELEKDLLVKFFEIKQIDRGKLLESLDKIEVLERDYTGSGFLTTFKKFECLRVADEEKSYKWGEIGATLNEERIEAGFLYYIEKGYLEALEGYTYGAQKWPDKILCYDVFKIDVQYIKNGQLLKERPPELDG